MGSDKSYNFNRAEKKMASYRHCQVPSFSEKKKCLVWSVFTLKKSTHLTFALADLQVHHMIMVPVAFYMFANEQWHKVLQTGLYLRKINSSFQDALTSFSKKIYFWVIRGKVGIKTFSSFLQSKMCYLNRMHRHKVLICLMHYAAPASYFSVCWFLPRFSLITMKQSCSFIFVY